MNKCDACGRLMRNERIWVRIQANEGLLPKSSISNAIVCADEGCIRLYLEWE